VAVVKTNVSNLSYFGYKKAERNSAEKAAKKVTSKVDFIKVGPHGVKCIAHPNLGENAKS
jgi:hypothetical protein